ncbi:ROK family protein [Paenibacillus sp. PAMC21692]|uniref:ROK family protein n=1 Tax=Paenibacillus sp. PAMC21692 TaxID=2762320 RepID=UPI00164E0AFC|nr:ROK family protein [Paenibacillus sp. PAMC21692]QNK55069.1 ROK family protein [Paenibacillus sp. PAMC21692]
MRIGAIEGGGTKFVCGIGNEQGVIEDRISFPTEEPEKVMAAIIDYFRNKDVEAIGIGTFGPIDIDPASKTYGYVTTTPKRGWSGFPFLATLKESFDVPMGWDTDVNAAAYGEAVWGAAAGLDSCVYFTIGTGIGVGVYSEGRLVHGLAHPEGGHILPRRHPDDRYEGACPYHGDCLEGLAAGPSLEKRWGVKGSELAPDHPAWEMEAYYIGQAVTSTILLLSPKRVILGGGVMHQKHLLPLIRQEVQRNLNGYVQVDAIINDINNYVVSPGLGDNAALCGSLALGVEAWRKSLVNVDNG